MSRMPESFSPLQRTVNVDEPRQGAWDVNDFMAGAAGGIAQVWIGQPFDLVKVRLQTQGQSRSIATVRSIWTKEGPLAFYKGSLVPLLGVGASVSIQVGAFQAFSRLIAEGSNKPLSKDSSLTTSQYYLAGGSAGVTNSIISGPIEHIRIRLQTQGHGATKQYSNPWDCAKKIYFLPQELLIDSLRVEMTRSALA